MVHPGGRPRTTSFSPDEMIALGEEMLQWLSENRDTIHLSQWYTIHKGFLYNEWKTFIQRVEFIPYYEQALKIVGLKYITKSSDVEPSLKQRWQRVYFKDLREEEDQTAIFNANLNKGDDVQGTEEQNKKLDAILNVMRDNQSSLNNAANNTSKE